MALLVSTAWKEAIKGQFRYPAYMRVLLTVAPPGMREGAVTTSPFTEAITNVATITDGNSDYCEAVATFETRRWPGDGHMYLPDTSPSGNKPIEWWSNTCLYTDANPVTLRMVFDTTYSIPGLYVVWDTETNSWPTKFTVVGYNVYGAEIGRYVITSVTQVEQYVEAQFDDIKTMDIFVHTWSKPEWRVRINEIVFGLYLRLGNNEIRTGELGVSSTLISEELPQFELSFVINNYDKSFDPKLQTGYSKYLVEKQQVKMQWGFEVSYGKVEWMDAWPLYLSSWQIPADTPEVSLSATHRLGFITSDYTKGTYNGSLKSMYNIALEVLQNSGIIHEQDSEIPWELDLLLKDFYTRAPVPIVASNVALQYVANAVGFFYDSNPINGFVRIRSSGKTPGYAITKAQQLGDPAFDIQDRLKSISVGMRSFSPKTTTEEVYKAELSLAGSAVLTARFGGDSIVVNPTITITGATVTASVYYARSAVLTIVAPAGGADVIIKINGTVVEEFVTFVTTYTNPEVSNGLEIEIDNPLMTEMSMATSLTSFLVDYYSKRIHLTVPYLGYPELELCDLISIPTTYGSSSGRIEKLNLSFNGGYDGSIEAVLEVD